MTDIKGLESLVENTAYVQAQQMDRNTLRDQRRPLSLPRPKRPTELREEVGTNYQSLCEQQPIGKKLFQQFLQSSSPQCQAAAEFLEELNDWHFAEDEPKTKAKQKFLSKFFHPDSRSFLSFLTEDVVEMCKGLSSKNFDEGILNKTREATTDFLREAPFTEYQKSPFFYRFLQWKEYEKQRINHMHFYEYRTIGKGGFGEVRVTNSTSFCFYLFMLLTCTVLQVCVVQAKHSGQMYACKKLDKKRLKKKGGEKLAMMEKQILEKVNSIFIVNLAYAFDNKTHLCLIMDLMNGGDLGFHIYDLGTRGLCMERVVYYTAQIATGILHLHSLNIIYRDMKPENVLLDSRGHCRLSDLGLAVELSNGKTICQKAGTTGYMAPEILRQVFYNTSVDWWSLGCSVYEMVAARLPFKDFREKVQNEEVTRRTLEDEVKFTHRKFDAATKDLIGGLLKKKPKLRLGCCGDDPRKHHFFKNINLNRLEAGLLQAPWSPKAHMVYAKNTHELRESSQVQDVKLNDKDEQFYKEFSTGAVPIRWQREMIENGVFEQLNDSQLIGPHETVWDSKACVIL
ncbi:rhodopsin kinase grk7-b-like isoform 1-T1 [Synchiropus picturatus]